MEKYNRLLAKISTEWKIPCGKTESAENWKIRILYTLFGSMAQASLLDVSELEEEEHEDVSITHIKRRISTLLDSYRTLYPELTLLLPIDAKELSEEIYNILLCSGTIYHSRYRATLAPKEAANEGSLRLLRSAAPDGSYPRSGLGGYLPAAPDITDKTTEELFCLNQIPLKVFWNKRLQRVQWVPFHASEKVEYLRTSPPFNYGYWQNQPDKSGQASLLRVGEPGRQLYYIYRFSEGEFQASQLPAWQVEEHEYRLLANACLAARDVLPPIKYHKDGQLVTIRFGYLPPPAELNLWKLYSWPSSCLNFSSDFKRYISAEVFDALKQTMLRQGYEFIEE